VGAGESKWEQVRAGEGKWEQVRASGSRWEQVRAGESRWEDDPGWDKVPVFCGSNYFILQTASINIYGCCACGFNI